MPVELTVLRLTGTGVPPYSARGLVQTITPIDAARSLNRTINGRLVDTSFDGHRKFATIIVGRDQQPPAFSSVWPGTRLTLDCIVEFAKHGNHLSAQVIDGRPVVPGSARMESGFTFYRPRLNVLVVAFDIERDEWGAIVGWTLSLEEDDYSGEAPTEATEEPTEAPTEPITEPPTEAPTEVPTEPVTEPPTEAPTETEEPTEPVTEPPTEVPTETEEPTEVPTEVPTETEAPTEPPTEAPTETEEPITEGGNRLLLEDDGSLLLEDGGNLLLEE